MENQNKSTGSSLSVVLFLIFMVLKLTGSIDWSWWWVTSPLWIPFVGIALVIFAGIVIALTKLNRK
jgi:hypothetical protein